MSEYCGVIFTSAPLNGVRPLGAYTLAHQLRLYNHNILVIDFFERIPKHRLHELLKKYISRGTIFLGYSNNFLSLDQSFEELLEALNSFAKTLNPDIKIIFGGSKSKQLMMKTMKSKNSLGIDYVFHGFSERMLLDFVENEINKIDHSYAKVLSKIKEIDYDQKGSSFDFHESNHRWHETDFITENETLPIEVARGCIFKCKFCAYPLLGKDIKDDSYIRKEENILNEILDNYEKYGTSRYFIVDDTFNERTDKIELLLRIRDRSKVDLSFVGYNRLDLIARKPNQLKLLKELNFDGMFFGIESLNYASAKAIGKGIRPEEIKNTLYKIKSEYPECSIYSGFIVGLPYETKETFYEWSSWLLSPESPVDSIDMNSLGLSFNTHSSSEFSLNPEKYGYRKKEDNPFEWENDHWNYYECRELADKFIEDSIKSGKQKISAFTAAGYMRYGYDYKTLIKTKKNEFNEIELKNKIKEFISNYLNKLLTHDNNQ